MTASVCAHGFELGRAGCVGCAAFVARILEEFSANVRAGKHDSRGYTVEERVASERRRQINLFWEVA
jgi:hypothetical protein